MALRKNKDPFKTSGAAIPPKTPALQGYPSEPAQTPTMAVTTPEAATGQPRDPQPQQQAPAKVSKPQPPSTPVPQQTSTRADPSAALQTSTRHSQEYGDGPALEQRPGRARLLARRNHTDGKKSKKDRNQQQQNTDEKKSSRKGLFRTKTADGTPLSVAQAMRGRRKWVFLRRAFMFVVGIAVLVVAVDVIAKPSQQQVTQITRAEIAKESTSFPIGDATTWAAPLVKTFGTYSPGTTDQRRQALAPYITTGLDEQLGWNGDGSQTVIDMVMSSTAQPLTAAQDPRCNQSNCAILHATIQIQTGSWLCIAIPTYAVKRPDVGSTAFSLLQAPAYVPCSGVTSPPALTTTTVQNDQGLADTFARGLLPQFMGAWVAGDQTSLSRYVLPGFHTLGLGGAFTGAGDGGTPAITDVFVPEAGSDNGIAADARTVTFTAQFLSLDGHATQESTYQVRVRRQAGQWFIADDPTPAYSATGVGGSGVPAPKPTTSGAPPSASPDPYPTGNNTGRPQGSPSDKPSVPTKATSKASTPSPPPAKKSQPSKKESKPPASKKPDKHK